jgi:hypothetical protein
MIQNPSRIELSNLKQYVRDEIKGLSIANIQDAVSVVENYVSLPGPRMISEKIHGHASCQDACAQTERCLQVDALADTLGESVAHKVRLKETATVQVKQFALRRMREKIRSYTSILQGMVPRQDLFAAFSVARRLQLEVAMKTEQIGVLRGKLERSEKTRVNMEKEILKLLNTFKIVFSGSVTDLKKHLNEFDVPDINSDQKLSIFPCSLRYQSLMEGVLSEVSIEFFLLVVWLLMLFTQYGLYHQCHCQHRRRLRHGHPPPPPPPPPPLLAEF